MDSLLRSRSLIVIRTVLFVSGFALFVLLGYLGGVAHAVIEDGGWMETNTNLAIRPDADPVETYLNDDPLMLVNMPVTKRISRVTIGDLRHACSNPARLELKIYRQANGDPWDTPTELVATSTSVPALSSTSAPVSWDVPPTTLKKGVTYVFRGLPRYDLSSCSNIRKTTWANSGPSISGYASCPRSAASNAWFRMWSGNGNECNAWNYSIDMPVGWLAVKPCNVGSCREVVTRGSSSVPTGSCAESYGWEWGGTWKYWRPTPSTPGYSDYVCEWSQYADPSVSPQPPGSRGWHYAMPWPGNDVNNPVKRRGAPRDMALTLETIDYGALISQYAPTTLYSAEENYFADAAESMTDWEENTLDHLMTCCGPPAWATMADHDTTSPAVDLTIGLLGQDYPTSLTTTYGPPTASSDRLKQNGDPQEASNAMRLVGNGDRVYGRAVHDSDGVLWVQYWFWYYYNDLAPIAGTHEGDWEMIQLRFGSNNLPDKVAYATHTGADRCSFSSVTVPGSSSPRVYVATGSHASYMSSGATEIAQGSYIDRHYGDREYSPQPSPVVVTGELATFWGWPGTWGSSAGSPPAPREQAKWSDPKGFYDSAEPCVGEASRKRQSRRPARAPAFTRRLPVPKIRTAVRTATRATVRYAVSQTPNLSERLFLEVTLQPRDPRNPSRTEYRRFLAGAHSVRVPLPLGGGPYRVEARVVDRHNNYGRVATKALP